MFNLLVVICDTETLFQSMALLTMYMVFILYRKHFPSIKVSEESLQMRQLRFEVAQRYFNAHASENEDYFLTNVRSQFSHRNLT